MSPAPLISFTIDCPRSGNSLLRSHWGSRGHARKVIYESVLCAVRQCTRWESATLHPTLPGVRRRVVFTRGVGIVQNAPTAKRSGSHPTNFADHDGMVSGLKYVLDSLLLWKLHRPGVGLLYDDAPEWLVSEYLQDDSGAVPAGKLLIEIFECEANL